MRIAKLRSVYRILYYYVYVKVIHWNTQLKHHNCTVLGVLFELLYCDYYIVLCAEK